MMMHLTKANCTIHEANWTIHIIRYNKPSGVHHICLLYNSVKKNHPNNHVQDGFWGISQEKKVGPDKQALIIKERDV